MTDVNRSNPLKYRAYFAPFCGDGGVANHYENFPMQYIYRDFLALKFENFQLKKFDIFLIFAQNIDCGYTL